MRALRSPAALIAVLAISCAEVVTLSDIVELDVRDDGPTDDAARELRTDVFRESDGQLVVQVFNDGPVAVRDVEIEIERVSRRGGRARLGDASIHRRIGARSMDQTRTSVFVTEAQLERVEARVTSAERMD